MEHGRQFKAEFGKTPRGVSRPQIWPMQFHQNILNNCIVASELQVLAYFTVTQTCLRGPRNV